MHQYVHIALMRNRDKALSKMWGTFTAKTTALGARIRAFFQLQAHRKTSVASLSLSSGGSSSASIHDRERLGSLSEDKQKISELKRHWEQIQNEKRKAVVLHDTRVFDKSLSDIKLVAGLDISYPRDAHEKSDTNAYAAVVICRFPTMEILHERVELVYSGAPYLSGFLAFRELQPLVNLLEKVLDENPHLKPDILLIDGNGTLHPQRCGIACHIGLHFAIPTIGVAKNLLLMDGVDCSKNMVQDMPSVGDCFYIKDNLNNILGMALKTAKDAKNPVYVSVGHNISLDTAKRVVIMCSKFRVPEPVRFADAASRKLIRKLESDERDLKH